MTLTFESYSTEVLNMLQSFQFWLNFIVSPILFSSAFLSRLRRRNLFIPRAILSVIGIAVLVIFICPLLEFLDRSLPWTFCFILITLFGWLCFNHSLFDILFCTISGFAIVNSANMVVEFFTASGIFPGNIGNDFYYLFYFVIEILFLVLSYLFIARQLERDADILMQNLWVFLVAIFLMICITGYLNNLPFDTLPEKITGYGFRIFLNVIIIAMLMAFRRNKKLHDEQEVLEEIIAKENENFKRMRSYMEAIDIKCHDYRALSQLSNVEGGNAELVSELSQSMEEYRNMPKTGNKALDVVLYDKIIVCRQKEIQLTYIVDGEALKILHSVDIAVLFNNLLNNAMEYVGTLEDKNKRLISMNVYTKFDFLYVIVENYCENEIKLVNGFPETSKEDKTLHGFGLKSVEYIAKKYGGASKIMQENKMFSVHVIVPLNQAEEKN